MLMPDPCKGRQGHRSWSGWFHQGVFDLLDEGDLFITNTTYEIDSVYVQSDKCHEEMPVYMEKNMNHSI